MLIVSNLLAITWQQAVMWVIGGLLIYLAIKKGMEPTLLLPMGFGAILVNLPFSGAVDQIHDGVLEEGESYTLTVANNTVKDKYGRYVADGITVKFTK